MSKLEWKYVSPLQDVSGVEEFTLFYCFRMPKDLEKTIIAYNAGTPSLSTYDLGERRGMVFGTLLSYNRSDPDNIYDYIGLFITEGGKKLNMLPFAIDPAGNFLCIKDNQVVLYEHEMDTCIPICDTVTDLFAMLY